MSNINLVCMWSKNCIDHLHVEACQRNHDPGATMLLRGNHS
jgi:hypothetical protein